MLANAPHLAQPAALRDAGYHWWERGFYGVGLKAYDAAGRPRSLGDTEFLSAARTRTCCPTCAAAACVAACATGTASSTTPGWPSRWRARAAARGALVLNHAPVTGLLRERGPQVRGVRCATCESGARRRVRARCVVNATGVWVDALRDMDRDAGAPQRPPPGRPQPGRAPGRRPRLLARRPCAAGAQDARRPGAVRRALAGQDHSRHHRHPARPGGVRAAPLREEVDFILGESARYLARAPRRADVRSVWVGMRPLVRPSADDGARHQGAVARAHGAGRALGPGHRHRRQVDHLPRDGRGRAASAAWRAACCRAGPAA